MQNGLHFPNSKRKFLFFKIHFLIANNLSTISANIFSFHHGQQKEFIRRKKLILPNAIEVEQRKQKFLAREP